LHTKPWNDAPHPTGEPSAPLCALFPETSPEAFPETSNQHPPLSPCLPAERALFPALPAGQPMAGQPLAGEPISSHGPLLPRAMKPERIEVLVDGSGDGHSIALFPGDEVYFSYERGASNNEAEFNAVILALENLPEHAHACVLTDSQVVVLHLTLQHRNRQPAFLRKSAEVQDLIARRHLKIEIQWIPRRQNRADRFLKHYIASLCGARGGEPLYRRVRRLESENLRLKAKLRKAMKLLESRPVVIQKAGISWESAGIGELLE